MLRHSIYLNSHDLDHSPVLSALLHWPRKPDMSCGYPMARVPNTTLHRGSCQTIARCTESLLAPREQKQDNDRTPEPPVRDSPYGIRSPDSTVPAVIGAFASCPYSSLPRPKSKKATQRKIASPQVSSPLCRHKTNSSVVMTTCSWTFATEW